MKRFTSIPTAGFVTTAGHRAGQTSVTLRCITLRRASSDAQGHSATQEVNAKMQAQQKSAHQNPKDTKAKTVMQLDEELRLRLEALSGDGGAAGVEYENGRAEGLKSEVKRNMFRVMNMK